MKIKFGTRCIIALILGAVFGRYVEYGVIEHITPISVIYLKLLRSVIVPLLFSVIISSFGKYKDFSLMKTISSISIFWFLITAITAGAIGIVIGKHFCVGLNVTFDVSSIDKMHLSSSIPLSQTLLNMVPNNIIGQISDGQIIPVVIFAIFMGLALASLGEQGATVRLFFDEITQIMFKIVKGIIKVSPIAIFILIADVSNKYGMNVIHPFGTFVFVMYLACILQIIVYMFLLLFVGKINPILFIKNFFPAMITAFTTSSSIGTLPVTIDRLVNHVKVRDDIASFVAPLGANMKMDGCGAIYPAVVSIFTANLLGMHLSFNQEILIFILSSFATFFTVGIPGAAIMSATFVLVSMNFPLQGLAIVIGIDKIIDMIRTVTNVTGAATCSVLVEKTLIYTRRL